MFWTKTRTSPDALQASRIDDLEKSVANLQDKFDDLLLQHQKLRGRFYAEFGSRVDAPGSRQFDLQSAQLTKDELRKLAGVGVARLNHGSKE